jgi:hypothetical protein
MFEPTSRYYEIENATLTTRDGRTVTYKRRRSLPQGSSLPAFSEVSVREGDRLDLLSARELGDPELFWRICDANDAMDPLDLTAEPGSKVRIPGPDFGGGG